MPLRLRRYKTASLMAAGLIGSFGASADPSATPNVVFILADDIGWGDLGSYGGVIPTPNLDRLANEGMRFTDAHSPAALCAPTRFSMMTGSNPYRNGRPWGTWSLKASSAFEANRHHETIGDVMQDAGYRTAFLGKQHFGGDPKDANGNVTRDYAQIDFSKPIADGISAHGFDYSLSLSSGIQNPPYVYFENDKFKPIDPNKPATNASITTWTPGTYPNPDGTLNVIQDDNNVKVGDVDWNSAAVGPTLANAAVDYIDDHLENHGSKPFMLYYASQGIHVPHTPANELNGTPIRGTTVNAKTDMIKELDAQVGAILTKLDAEGITDNTMIIFTSDNGGLRPIDAAETAAGHDSVNGLRNYKGSEYEGGVRVPFLVKWGDGTDAGSYVKPGAVSDQGISALDWIASMYDLTGQDMAANQAMDSTSLLPVLFGHQDESDPIHEFYISQSSLQNYNDSHHMVYHEDEEGDWVLMLNPQRQAIELYNLDDDLAQTNNLINEGDQAARIQEIRSWFLAHDGAGEPRSTAAFNVSAQTPLRETNQGIMSLNIRAFDNDINNIDADETYGSAAEGSVTPGWMNVGGPDNPQLFLADGTPTNISTTGTNPGGTQTVFNAGLNDTPMRAGLATYSPTAANFPTLEISGISETFSSYDLIVYLASNDGADEGQITDGTTTYFFSAVGGTGVPSATLTESSDTDSSDGIDEGNYVVFRGLTADSVTLEIRNLNQAAGNGGSFVAIAGFQIKGTLAAPGPAGDLSGDGDVDDEDLGLFFSAFTGPDLSQGPLTNPAADLSGDGDVDDEDLGIAFGTFTGPLAPINVPEPASLAIIPVAGLCMTRRPRHGRCAPHG